MVGIFKAEINGFDRNKLHIRAENKAVDDIVLGILRIVRIVGLIEQAAGQPPATARMTTAMR